MKGFCQYIEENFLDDIIREIESDHDEHGIKKLGQIKVNPKKRKKVPINNRYRPRKYSGVKPEGFSGYIRSMGELKGELKEKLGHPKVTLRGIIDLYAKHDLKVTDNFQPMISVKELWYVREYDRKMVDGWTGKNTAAEMKELIVSVKKDGIKEYGHVSIDRRKNGDVEVILGEGNHRLSIAKHAGIKEMPIMFSYGRAR